MGPATLRVTTAIGFAEAPVTVSDAAPARIWDFLTIYAVGLGELSRGIAAGQSAPGSPPIGIRSPVQVRIDDVSLTPGFAGLHQVNVQIPGDLRGGSHRLVVVVGATGSEPVGFPIASAPGL